MVWSFSNRDKTEEAAWQENFKRDVRNMLNEILVALNKNKKIPEGKKFIIKEKSSDPPIWELEIKFLSSKIRDFSVFIGILPTKKIRYGLYFQLCVNKEYIPPIDIPLSYASMYTKDELNKAKNRILTPIVEYLGL